MGEAVYRREQEQGQRQEQEQVVLAYRATLDSGWTGGKSEEHWLRSDVGTGSGSGSGRGSSGRDVVFCKQVVVAAVCGRWSC